MLFNRTNTWVALGLLFLLGLAAPSFGQGPQGCQLFAPADLSTYGGGQAPNEGYWFQYDVLYWSISAPENHLVGAPGERTVFYGPTTSPFIDNRGIQTSSLDTSFLKQQFSVGNRIEFGRMEDRNGWGVSIFQQRDQTQNFLSPAASMVFEDPGLLLVGNVNNDATTVPPYSPPRFENLPVTLYNVSLENSLDTWGVELNYMHRFLTDHGGGNWEMFLGARYFEFNDNFRVHTATDDGTHNVPSFLGGSYWDTEAQNHVVGPQIGLRWFKKQGRWTFSTEGRFMMGYNCQNIQQQVDMGPDLDPGPRTTVRVNPTPPPVNLFDFTYPPFEPKTMGHTTATHTVYAREWSPAFELRLEGRYQITRALSFHAGWTGMWMDGIARANSVIDYTVPGMGVNMADNRQDILMNGLTIGIDFNR
jgi:hypothetical protein